MFNDDSQQTKCFPVETFPFSRGFNWFLLFTSSCVSSHRCVFFTLLSDLLSVSVVTRIDALSPHTFHNQL